MFKNLTLYSLNYGCSTFPQNIPSAIQSAESKSAVEQEAQHATIWVPHDEVASKQALFKFFLTCLLVSFLLSAANDETANDMAKRKKNSNFFIFKFLIKEYYKIILDVFAHPNVHFY